MRQIEIEDLIKRYNQGKCSEEESALLETWYLKWNHKEPLKLSDEMLMEDLLTNRRSILSKVIINRRDFKLWQHITAVAAAIAVVVFGVWFFSAPRQHEFISASVFANDIAPGKKTATLTLANGNVINLSGAKTGVVIAADKLTYSDGTAIVSPLEGTKQPSPDEIAQILTASTPRGGTYEFTLPDGTKVWLNANSKISFPSRFPEKERKILLSGEAYFDVVHNAKKPFRVESRGQLVEDIGTVFNINAYGDEPVVKTTLLEGSASVTSLVAGVTTSRGTPRNDEKSGLKVLLKPNQQSVLTASNRINVKEANIEEAVAWKNGYFRFNGQTITEIMLQLSRWYNIEVEYEGTMTNEGFYGKISRDKNISDMLKMLEKTGLVYFKVEGGRVTVLK